MRKIDDRRLLPLIVIAVLLTTVLGSTGPVLAAEDVTFYVA